jgi:hypothetical protein
VDVIEYNEDYLHIFIWRLNFDNNFIFHEGFKKFLKVKYFILEEIF